MSSSLESAEVFGMTEHVVLVVLRFEGFPGTCGNHSEQQKSKCR